MKTRFFISLFVLAMLFSTAIVAADNTITLNVMTFNIRYGTANDGENSWAYRDSLVFQVIQDQNPDIIGLQEALKFQIDAILANCPDYAKIGVGRDDGDTLGEYSALLFKPEKFMVNESGTFWFSDTPEVVASKSWGNNITRICTWAGFLDKASGKMFYAFNVHLDHQSQPSRVKSAQLLATTIQEKCPDLPFIVTGDFNAGESNEAVTFLTQTQADLTVLPVIDTFRALFPNATEVGTFNGFTGDKSGEKIDYIFVPRSFEVLAAAILYDNKNGSYPSDHFPVTAKVRF